MEYISQKHRGISEWHNDRVILTNPELYFGPNYKALLNYWIFYERLTEGAKENYWGKIWALDGTVWERHRRIVDESFNKVNDIISVATMAIIEREICAAHLILDQGESLVFLPLMVDAFSSVTPT